MDLAYNVDDRARRGILEIAVSMYKNTIDAKNSKREMQLKVMKLMQDQQKLDLDERKFRADQGEEVIETKSTIVEDRNELIKRIRAQSKEEQKPPEE
jgi:phage-related minor tail protein